MLSNEPESVNAGSEPAARCKIARLRSRGVVKAPGTTYKLTFFKFEFTLLEQLDFPYDQHVKCQSQFWW
jgi:hypothetical protein